MSSHPFYQPPTSQTSAEQPAESTQERDASPPSQRAVPEPQPEVMHPSVDMIDTSEAIKIFADLPGFKQEEIHVRCEGSNLRITAERHSETETGNDVLVRERPLKAERMLSVPVSVDHDESTATYEDGVCRITLPKREAQQYTEISFS